MPEEKILNCFQCNDRMWDSNCQSIYCTKKICQFKPEPKEPDDPKYDKMIDLMAKNATRKPVLSRKYLV